MRVFRSNGPKNEIGDYINKASATERNGWKLCNGKALDRDIYAALFNEIGITYGSGDGSTTFNLPDMRGRVLGSAGQGVFASTFANTDVTVATNKIAVSANYSLYTGTAAVLSTTGTAPTGLAAGTTCYVIRSSSVEILLASSLANAIAGTAIDITGQGIGNHTLTITYTNRSLGDIVGEETHGLTIAEIPSHTHDFTDNYGVQNLEATFNNGNATDEIERAETTTATGGSASHNIMQPTIFAGYCFIYAGVN